LLFGGGRLGSSLLLARRLRLTKRRKPGVRHKRWCGRHHPRYAHNAGHWQAENLLHSWRQARLLLGATGLRRRLHHRGRARKRRKRPELLQECGHVLQRLLVLLLLHLPRGGGVLLTLLNRGRRLLACGLLGRVGSRFTNRLLVGRLLTSVLICLRRILIGCVTIGRLCLFFGHVWRRVGIAQKVIRDSLLIRRRLVDDVPFAKNPIVAHYSRSPF